MKIKDRIVLGAVSGLLAGVPGRLINAVEYKAGLTDLKYQQQATSLFIPKNKSGTLHGKILASLVNNTNVSITGVIICYLLSASGRDHAIIKGAGVGAFSWVIINGVVSNLGLKNKYKKPLSPILSFFDHVILGSLTGLLVSKLGDDSLFPETKN